MVDDEHITHRLVQLILKKENHQIASAYNGIEAMKFLREKPVDLLITDVNMPFMDGFSLVDQLRANDRYAMLPIIMISEYPFPHIPVQAMKKGVNAFLSQPFSSWQLIQLVNEYVKAEQPSSAGQPASDRKMKAGVTMSPL